MRSWCRSPEPPDHLTDVVHAAANSIIPRAIAAMRQNPKELCSCNSAVTGSGPHRRRHESHR